MKLNPSIRMIRKGNLSNFDCGVAVSPGGWSEYCRNCWFTVIFPCNHLRGCFQQLVESKLLWCYLLGCRLFSQTMTSVGRVWIWNRDTSSFKRSTGHCWLSQRSRLCLISPTEPLCFEFALSDSLIVLSSGLDVVIPSQTLILGEKWSKFLWPLVEGGHTCKLHIDKPPVDDGFEPRNILFWGKSVNHHTTLKTIYY